MSEWQLIESAPRDGTNVFVLEGGKVWPSRYRVIERFENGALQYRNEGWQPPIHSIGARDFSPTHWLPVPDLPAQWDGNPQGENGEAG